MLLVFDISELSLVFVLTVACSGGGVSCKILNEWDLSVHHVCWCWVWQDLAGRSHHWELMVSSPSCMALGAKSAPPLQALAAVVPWSVGSSERSITLFDGSFNSNGSPLSTLPSVGLGRPAFLLPPSLLPSLPSQVCFWLEAKAKAAAQPKAKMGSRGAKSLEKLPTWEGSCLSEKQVSNGSK